MIDVFIETNTNRWQHSYNFSAVREGCIVKENFLKETPANFMEFIFNTCRTIFEYIKSKIDFIFPF